MAEGVGVGSAEEYCRLADSDAQKIYSSIFYTYNLENPTVADFEQLLGVNEARGFLGMFANLDCMHYCGHSNIILLWSVHH